MFENNRQIKFLSDVGNQFDKLHFLITNGAKSQSIDICDYL